MGNHSSDEGNAGSPDGVGGDPNKIFRALSSVRCRRLLAVLHASDGVVSLQDAAAHLAAWESGEGLKEIGEGGADQLLVAIYHVTVPKLEDAGLVDFDSGEQTITVTDLGAQIERMPLLPTVG